MQTMPAVSVEQLADDLMRFFVRLMRGDQHELFAVVAQLDLTVSQMRGLFVLNVAERGLALTELAPQVGLSVAAAGRSVDGLVRKGLVARSEDPLDRRVKRLTLTDAGRGTIAEIAGARREGFRRYAASLGERQRAVLSEAFETVLEAAS